jgi:hypothetical protein
VVVDAATVVVAAMVLAAVVEAVVVDGLVVVACCVVAGGGVLDAGPAVVGAPVVLELHAPSRATNPSTAADLARRDGVVVIGCPLAAGA